MKMGFSKKEIVSDGNYSISKELPDKRQNRSIKKSNLTLMKPRDKARVASKSVLRPAEPVFRKVSLSSTDEMTILDAIRQSEEITPIPNVPVRATVKDKIRSDSIIFRQSANIGQTIQIGVLNLGSLDKIGEMYQKKNLPLWQFTAIDKAAGAAWTALAYEFGCTQLNAFVKYLSDNFGNAGKTTTQTNIEFHFDIMTGRRLNREDYDGIKEYCAQYFAAAAICHDTFREESPLNEFHSAIIQKFYLSEEIAVSNKLLAALHTYLLRYNFNENYESTSDLPPYQLICRQEGGSCRQEILTGKPIVLDKNIGIGIKYLASLKLLVGGMIAFTASVIARRKRDLLIKLKPQPPHNNNSFNSLLPQTACPPETSCEYISLKDIAWRKSDENPVNSRKYSNKIRNRQEIIDRALKLLAEKRPMAELKRDLPITEGEISILSRNLMLNKEVRTS
jgi:hypothetical protein